MIGWSVELSKFDIRYKPRDDIKFQCLTDFFAKLTPLLNLSTGWTLYVEDSTNRTTTSRAGTNALMPCNKPGEKSKIKRGNK